MIQAGKVIRSAVVNDELRQNYKQRMPIAGVRLKPLKRKGEKENDIFFVVVAHLRLRTECSKGPSSPVDSPSSVPPSCFWTHQYPSADRIQGPLNASQEFEVGKIVLWELSYKTALDQCEKVWCHLGNKISPRLRHSDEWTVGTDVDKESTYEKDGEEGQGLSRSVLPDRLHLPALSQRIRSTRHEHPFTCLPDFIPSSPSKCWFSSCSPCGFVYRGSIAWSLSIPGISAWQLFSPGNELISSIAALNMMDWYLKLGGWQLTCLLLGEETPAWHQLDSCFK